MLAMLRELFAGLTPGGRFWLGLAILAAVVAVVITLVLTGGDLAPIWGLLAN